MLKPKVIDESGKPHDLQLVQDTWMGFAELSKYLFASDNPIYDINEMPPSSKFYKPAQGIASELGIDWKKMTHEESNRIMLALLEDYYKAMADVKGDEHLILELNLRIK